jgi:cold shock CspA family protein
MPREIGRCKFFVEAKGYGFVRRTDGTDLFFHVSQTGGLYPNLGDRLSFEVGENPRTGKSEAKNVSILDGEAS